MISLLSWRSHDCNATHIATAKINALAVNTITDSIILTPLLLAFQILLYGRLLL